MTIKTEEQNLLARVDELDGEIEELERRKEEALAQIERAERRFGELDERRTALSPKAFSGDGEAAQELSGLEDEHDVLARSGRVARSAVPEFERMLEEAGTKRDEAQADVHRSRYRALLDKANELDLRRDDLAEQLKEALEEQSQLKSAMAQEMQKFDPEQANRLVIDALDSHRYWLSETFGQWLR